MKQLGKSCGFHLRRKKGRLPPSNEATFSAVEYNHQENFLSRLYTGLDFFLLFQHLFKLVKCKAIPALLGIFIFFIQVRFLCFPLLKTTGLFPNRLMLLRVRRLPKNKQGTKFCFCLCWVHARITQLMLLELLTLVQIQSKRIN